MLRLGKTWITSRFKQHLYDTRREKPIRIYMKEKYDWDDATFDGVDWNAIGRIRRKLSFRKKVQTCKIIHGWLPTMNKNFRVATTRCPACRCQNETTNHVLVCPNPRMKTKREEIIAALRKKGLGRKVPRSMTNALCDLIEAHFNTSSDPSFLHYPPPIQTAIRAQRRIGTAMLLRGILVKEWASALADMKLSNPTRAIDTIIRYLWDDIVLPLWYVRNDILHRHKNRVQEADDNALNDSLAWYLRHKHEIMSIHDQHLARFDFSDIPRMSRRVKRAWKYHLDKARKACLIESRQRQAGQSVITRFLVAGDPPNG